MITRHHVALALICSLIIGIAIVPFSPGLFLVLVTGTCIGSVLPDIQMTKPKKFCTRSLAWCIVQFTKFACMPLICRCYRAIPAFRAGTCDKRVTHSVPGVLFVSGILTGIIYSSAALSGTHVPDPANAFLAGIFLGMILHLAEDLCTRKGITPLFPFSDLRITGSIRPCDAGDRRIGHFHVQHCSVLILFFTLCAAGMIPSRLVIPAGFTGIAACVVFMISLSSVKISPGDFQPSPGTQAVPNAG